VLVILNTGSGEMAQGTMDTCIHLIRMTKRIRLSISLENPILNILLICGLEVLCFLFPNLVRSWLVGFLQRYTSGTPNSLKDGTLIFNLRKRKIRITLSEIGLVSFCKMSRPSFGPKDSTLRNTSVIARSSLNQTGVI